MESVPPALEEEDEGRNQSLPIGFNIVPPSPKDQTASDSGQHPLADQPDGEALSLFSPPSQILQALLDPEWVLSVRYSLMHA